MKRFNGSTRTIMRRRITKHQWKAIDVVPERYRLGAIWRTLKYGHPFPQHKEVS